MPNRIAIAAVIAISALMIFVGVCLSVMAMLYKYKEKHPLLRNSEMGLVIIQVLTFLSVCIQVGSIVGNPANAQGVWFPTIAIRILFFWVPLNYYLYVQKLKKQHKNK